MRVDPLAEGVGMLVLVLAVFMLFAVLPPIDLWVSGLFYTQGRGFRVNGAFLPELLRTTVWRVSMGMVGFALFAALRKALLRHDTFGVPSRIWLFVLALYSAGPGVLVDLALKPNWGRTRPDAVAEFGGPALFTLPGQLGGTCTGNCSFVSGEVAGTTALAICLALILKHLHPRPARYRLLLAISLSLPLIIALQRIAAGRHFLSDALFAALFIGILARVLWHLMKPARPWG